MRDATLPGGGGGGSDGGGARDAGDDGDGDGAMGVVMASRGWRHWRAGWLLLCAGLLLAYSLAKPPKANWDMIGYVAAAYHYLGLEGQELHRATYADIRAAVSDAHFQRLVDGRPFHRAVHQDPQALSQQTHYRTRVSYVLLTLAVSGLTGSVAQATYLVSIIASAATLLLLGSLLLRERLAVFLLFPIVLASTEVTSITSLARYSTPDMLAVMTAVAIVCAGLHRPRLALLLLPLLPTVRPDYILLAPLFAYALHEPAHRLRTAMALGLTCLAYLLATSLFATYGYLTDFNYTFIQGPQPYPEAMRASQDIMDYVRAYPPGIRELASHGQNYLIPLAAILACLSARRGGFQRRSLAGFTLAAAVFALLHFMLFPLGHYRLYMVAICLSLVTLFAAASQLYGSSSFAANFKVRGR